MSKQSVYKGYKGNRKPWWKQEKEYRECHEKLWILSQEKKNLKRIEQGLDPLPIEPYPIFEPVTNEFLYELEKLTIAHASSNETGQNASPNYPSPTERPFNLGEEDPENE